MIVRCNPDIGHLRLTSGVPSHSRPAAKCYAYTSFRIIRTNDQLLLVVLASHLISRRGLFQIFRSGQEHSPMRIANPFIMITHVIGSLREADVGLAIR